MFVRLYPDEYSPAPAGRVVILTRPAHAGFGKAKVKAQSKSKNNLLKRFFVKLFSLKKVRGCGQRPRPAYVGTKAYDKSNRAKNQKA
jgi:hypothetical protein